jgi:glutamyl-tRNA reductase
MALVALGVDHHATPLAERERLAYSSTELLRVLPQLRASVGLDECAVLSTCNRTEVYGVRGQLTGAFERMAAFLAADRRVAPQLIEGPAFRLHDDAAVGHLFRVASGLESVVLGESQVLGQVRASLTTARRAGTLGPELEALGRYAIVCGKRARTESAIARAPMSFAQAAVTLVRQERGALRGARLLVVGTGTMAGSAITWFKRGGVSRITVVSRTSDRAAALAARRGVRAVPMRALEAALAESDVVVASTTGAEPVLTPRRFATPRAQLVYVIDLGVPRSVAAAVGDLPRVRLFNLDDLQRVVASSLGARTGEVSHVEGIIEEEAARYLAWQRARHVAPAIAQLHAQAEAVRSAEWQRFQEVLSRLPSAQQETVARLTHSIVNKLLHGPVVRLKAYAQSPHGTAYVDAIRNLFGLEAAEPAQPAERAARK